MKSLSLVAALAASQVLAQPTQLEETIEKRQAGGLGALLGGLPGLGGAGGSGNAAGLGGLLSSVRGKDGNVRLGKILGEKDFNVNLVQGLSLFGSIAARSGFGIGIARAVNGKYGPVAAPANAAARIVTEKTRISLPGAKTVKIRYGPYLVPNMNSKNLLGDGGMLWNYPHGPLEKPCSGDCTIMGMNAGLEYLDGTNANIDTGMWLHHMVLFNIGPGRRDFTCGDKPGSIPHIMMNATSGTSERIFASGNERTVGILPQWNVNDAGYKLKSTDKFAALVELMNDNMEDKTVWLTMTYDIIQGHPFKDEVRVVWFDVQQCGTSEVNPPANKDQFTLSYKWTSTIDAEVIGSIEHMHDGGARMTLEADGKVACNSTTLYATKPEFVAKPKEHSMGGGHSHVAAPKHISDQALCYGDSLPYKQMKKGQVWTANAEYDFSKNPGNKHGDGDWEEVMGIAITFVRIKG